MDQPTTARAPVSWTMLRLFLQFLQQPLAVRLGRFEITGPSWACLLALSLVLYFGYGLASGLGDVSEWNERLPDLLQPAAHRTSLDLLPSLLRGGTDGIQSRTKSPICSA